MPEQEHTPNPEIADRLETAKKFRHWFINDLPPHHITPEDPNYTRYKCRTSWWTGLASFLRILKKTEVIENPETLREIDDFLNFLYALDYDEFRTKGEIDRADAVLDIVIGDLETRI